MRAGHLQECFGNRAEFRLLAPCHGLEPAAERALPTRLHLAEDEDSPAFEDKVELSETTAPVPSDDPRRR